MANIPALPVTVILSDLGVGELDTMLHFWMVHSEMLGHYIRCRSVDASGQYFKMVLVQATGLDYVDVEFNVPHAFVKCFLSGPEPSQFGFKALV